MHLERVLIFLIPAVVSVASSLRRNHFISKSLGSFSFKSSNLYRNEKFNEVIRNNRTSFPPLERSAQYRGPSGSYLHRKPALNWYQKQRRWFDKTLR